MTSDAEEQPIWVDHGATVRSSSTWREAAMRKQDPGVAAEVDAGYLAEHIVFSCTFSIYGVIDRFIFISGSVLPLK